MIGFIPVNKIIFIIVVIYIYILKFQEKQTKNKYFTDNNLNILKWKIEVKNFNAVKLLYNFKKSLKYLKYFIIYNIRDANHGVFCSLTPNTENKIDSKS